MSIILIMAILVALLGFVLLLEPQVLWRRVKKGEKLSNGTAAVLRLIGIAVLLASVVIAEMV